MEINFYAPENVSITPADEIRVVVGKSIAVEPGADGISGPSIRQAIYRAETGKIKVETQVSTMH